MSTARYQLWNDDGFFASCNDIVEAKRIANERGRNGDYVCVRDAARFNENGDPVVVYDPCE